METIWGFLSLVGSILNILHTAFLNSQMTFDWDPHTFSQSHQPALIPPVLDCLMSSHTLLKLCYKPCDIVSADTKVFIRLLTAFSSSYEGQGHLQ